MTWPTQSEPAPEPGWLPVPLHREAESSRTGARKAWRKGDDTIEEVWEYCSCCMTYRGTVFETYANGVRMGNGRGLSTFNAAAEALRKKATGEDEAERLERRAEDAAREAAEARAKVRQHGA